MQISFWKNGVIGFLSAVLVSALLLLLFGWLCVTREDPEQLIGILGSVALYVSAAVGGFVAARFNKKDGLLSGLVSGGALMLLVIVLSFILREGQERATVLNWIMFFIIPAVSAFGGYVGIPSGKKRKKHRKKR